MRQTIKPFIVERKPSRKLRPGSGKPSIWGKLDLSAEEDMDARADPSDTAAAGAKDERDR